MAFQYVEEVCQRSIQNRERDTGENEHSTGELEGRQVCLQWRESRQVAGEEAGEMSSKHITQGLAEHKKGRFYSESAEKPVEG